MARCASLSPSTSSSPPWTAAPLARASPKHPEAKSPSRVVTQNKSAPVPKNALTTGPPSATFGLRLSRTRMALQQSIDLALATNIGAGGLPQMALDAALSAVETALKRLREQD